MGRRGPAPEPTSIKLLKGNPGRRPLNDREPEPKRARPRCPNWLSKDARAIWKTLVPQLRDMGVLTRIDGQALTRYCTLWARWKRAEQFIEKHGDVYPFKDDRGNLKYLQQFPQVAIAHKLATHLTRLEQEFGMTPSSRSRIRIERDDRVDEFETFLQANRA